MLKPWETKVVLTQGTDNRLVLEEQRARIIKCRDIGRSSVVILSGMLQTYGHQIYGLRNGYVSP